MPTDPTTGDTLTSGEYLSWHIQSVIRRWPFLGIITALTVIAWLTNNPAVLTWWNLSASYMALVIESVVGIAMFSQTKRDAVVMREIRAISQRLEQTEQRQQVILDMLLLLSQHEQQELETILQEQAKKAEEE